MPIYEYSCSICGLETEELQGYHDEPYSDCASCGSEGTNHRLISIPYIAVKNCNTLGSLAEKNRAKLGHYGVDAKQQEIVSQYKSDTAFKGKLRDGTVPESIPVKPSRPFYRPDTDKPDTKLLKASPEAINNYVMTGKRPFGT